MSTIESPERSAASHRRRLTAKALFIVAGTLSFLLSVSLWFLFEERQEALFVGLWVPSLFSLGALVTGPGGWSR